MTECEKFQVDILQNHRVMSYNSVQDPLFKTTTAPHMPRYPFNVSASVHYFRGMHCLYHTLTSRFAPENSRVNSKKLT